MGFLNTLKDKARKIAQDNIARWHADTATLEISGNTIRWAFWAAVGRSNALKKISTSWGGDSYRLKVVLNSGVTVELEIVPRHLTLNKKTITVTCRLPGGIKIGHESWIKNLFVGVFDGLFGVSKKAVQQIPGVTLNGEMMTFSRDIGDTFFATALGRFLKDETKTVPMLVRNGTLELDFAEVVPKNTEIDWSSLINAITPHVLSMLSILKDDESK